MADKSYTWRLIEGIGRSYGVYAIERLEEDKDTFSRDGAAQRIGFEFTVQCVDETNRVHLGQLTPEDISPEMLDHSSRRILE